MKIAIVEDDPSMAEELKGYFTLYSKDNPEVSFSCQHFLSAEAFLSNKDTIFDIILLDIELPGINGMECAKKIREKNQKSVIIFVTNLAQYAIKGYEVNAFDFVVKPVSYYNFLLKIKRVLSFIDSNKQNDIIVSTREGKHLININKLKYVEIVSHSVVYHTTEGDIAATGTLKAIDSQLKKFHFAFCNQCYLVNLKYVLGVNGNDLILPEETLRIAGSRKKAFMGELTAFICER